MHLISDDQVLTEEQLYILIAKIERIMNHRFLTSDCPVKVGLRYMNVKNSELSSSTRTSRKESLPTACFSKVKVNQ